MSLWSSCCHARISRLASRRVASGLACKPVGMNAVNASLINTTLELMEAFLLKIPVGNKLSPPLQQHTHKTLVIWKEVLVQGLPVYCQSVGTERWCRGCATVTNTTATAQWGGIGGILKNSSRCPIFWKSMNVDGGSQAGLMPLQNQTPPGGPQGVGGPV